MEPKFQSSFIPKGPLATAGTATKLSQSSGRSFLGTLAVFVFVITILLSLGAFGYEFYLKRSIVKMGQDLDNARKSLEPEVINRISSLDLRLSSTKRLLESHTILTPLFDYLEESTLRLVRLTSFRFDSRTDGLKLELKGEARGYSTLALQSEIFNNSPYFNNVSFGDLSLDKDGNVIFSLKAGVKPEVISFKKKFDIEAQAAPVVPAVTEPTATTTSTSTPI